MDISIASAELSILLGNEKTMVLEKFSPAILISV
jgi:hypothetical protein